MGNVVGIDLGTTNSVAAFKFAEVEVVTAEDNPPPERKLTRSAVALDRDYLIAGQGAYNQLRANPENVIVSIKRLMGRGIGDIEVREQRDRLSYKIDRATHGTDLSLSVWLGGKEYQPEDISAEILKKVAHNAQLFQRQQGQTSTISEAVITIPAYFNDKQRHATRSAAARAGLKVRELLPEPTAAAISYGFTPEESSEVKTILVYDFGGGTFDASLLVASGDRFIELGKAGDLWLGGDDIDRKMIEWAKERIAEQEGIEIDRAISQMPNFHRVRFLADLKIAVEWAKIALSSAPSAHIIPPTPFLNELGIPVPIDIEITQEQFEELIAPIVDRAIAICNDAVRYSEYTNDLIDVVLLVGGSCQIPLVQQKVKEAFGSEKVVVHPRPLYAVAEGAAIVAAGLTEKVETVSRDYYIKLADGLHKVVPRGEVLPFRTAQTFKTVANGQRLIRFEFFNRDDERDVMEPIGKMWLPLYSSYPQGTEVLVALELDEQMGDLQITAVLKNDPSVKVSSLFSRGGSDEQMNEEVDRAIQEINTRQLSTAEVEEASQQVVRVVQVTNQIIDPKTGREREDVRQQAQERLNVLKSALSEELNIARSLAYECDFLVQTYDFAHREADPCGIAPPQQERLKSCAAQLRDALHKNDLSAISIGIEEAKQEISILPDTVQRLRYCRAAIYRANHIQPVQGRILSDKTERFIAALRRNESAESERLWQELSPNVQYWLNQSLPTGAIDTDLML
ncbi:Hsp70 family protein [Lusitaniella coriacea LEGE 07157]|uniref:Hsp70 family protein n=1 Tax=Lusitaniella coriacea LEGE 07157 TaxID=945747 RepID=A0A8J7J5A8_9CYAN|nr:Hsp70 family protein [Lusitaniella coriacea]MBE9117904.1 Hsp70 family protein [Lusitaniella coriacea LEGE 07157]